MYVCFGRTERDATNWSSEKLKELMVGLNVENDDGRCEITEVSSVEGEASINNRKGKLIFFYEWNLKAQWNGKSRVFRNINQLYDRIHITNNSLNITSIII